MIYYIIMGQAKDPLTNCNKFKHERVGEENDPHLAVNRVMELRKEVPEYTFWLQEIEI